MHRLQLTAAALLIICCSGATASIQCYSRSGSTASTNGATRNCLSDSRCYMYSDTRGNWANCGPCSDVSITYRPSCTDCGSNLCNRQPEIRCNDNVATSGKICTGYNKCYNYTSTGSSFVSAGCGDCRLYSSSNNCTECSADYCNTIPSITCKTRSGQAQYSGSGTQTCRGHTMCYEYQTSSLFSNRFYAGCGDCTNRINCRSCSTNECNAAAAVDSKCQHLLLLLLLLAVAATG